MLNLFPENWRLHSLSTGKRMSQDYEDARSGKDSPSTQRPLTSTSR